MEGPGLPKDYISINNCDRFLTYLTTEPKGGNSYVFKVVDPNNEEVDRVIKFCRYYSPNNNDWHQRRLERFEREIRALKQAETSGYGNFVIRILHDGSHVMKGKTFRYYVMEMANCDLANYLVQEGNVLLQQKVALCFDILKAVKALHAMDIYHRDLKPDNILFVGASWKIGDLGLIAYRAEDVNLDEDKEKIGPFGLLSPEATNKALGNREWVGFNFDCIIDKKSDVFQLGKIFWYILQGEIPSGQLSSEDFKAVGQPNLFQEVILPMMQYAKSRRPAIEEVESKIRPICQDLAVL